MRSKLLKITGLVVLILLATEGILTVIGHSFYQPHKEDFDPTSDEKKIRILALGESTTDQRVAWKGKAWPRLLEEMLNSSGHQVKVYNKGIMGTNSAMILSALPGYLETFRPHIVISMMGINDTGTFSYDYTETPFRLLRFILLLRDRMSSILSCKLDEVWPPMTPEDGELLEKLKGADVTAVEGELRKTIRDNKKIAHFLAYSGMLRRSEESLRFYERALELEPMNSFVVMNYLKHFEYFPSTRCMKTVERLIPCADNLPDGILYDMVTCFSHTGRNLNELGLNFRGVSVINPSKGVLSKHYKLMADILKRENVKLVAMQYPTLPVESLKAHFSANEGKEIIFVENVLNFEEALKKSPFEEIFADRFRGSWGHTTDRGHALIAREVAEKIEPIIRKINDQK